MKSTNRRNCTKLIYTGARKVNCVERRERESKTANEYIAVNMNKTANQVI